ncbi:N-formylglutamate amidohydrolase [bacterium]|nr:N-formylglutamate amidohydrolase [bacterium]
MKNKQSLHVQESDSPIVATAIHDGHELRDEVADLMLLTESERLREEDPYTGKWTQIAKNRIIVKNSRFQVDLNRSRDKAIYLLPKDAWGLNIWKQTPSNEIIQRSLLEYDNFYSKVKKLLKDLELRYKYFMVLDLHSYNHLRDGQDQPPADPEFNPEVIVGTSNMNREFWAPVVDRFISDLRSFNFLGRNLDVRENVKFRGGHFSRWIHENFPNSGCAIAIEFKKFFMNEWTGKLDLKQSEAIKDTLRSTIAGVNEKLNFMANRI